MFFKVDYFNKFFFLLNPKGSNMNSIDLGNKMFDPIRGRTIGNRIIGY
jgi:hypothetical protein